jgi:hypothetical protein
MISPNPCTTCRSGYVGVGTRHYSGPLQTFKDWRSDRKEWKDDRDKGESYREWEARTEAEDAEDAAAAAAQERLDAKYESSATKRSVYEEEELEPSGGMTLFDFSSPWTIGLGILAVLGILGFMQFRKKRGT